MPVPHFKNHPTLIECSSLHCWSTNTKDQMEKLLLIDQIRLDMMKREWPGEREVGGKGNI